MSDHGHGAAASAGGQHRGRLAVAFGLVAVFFVVELITGLAVNSLALLSDAGHMLTDVLGLGMALAAIQAAVRLRGNSQRSFGFYRLEILAALANAVLLFGVAVYVLVEAFGRLTEPPEIVPVPLLVVAILGLAVNAASFFLLRSGAQESLNMRAAMLEVGADTLGSVGVVVSGVVLAVTGWPYVDPIVAALIGVFILPRTFSLGRQALRILTQTAPPHAPVEAVRGELRSLTGVVDVHDVHVWTLTSGMDVASAHVMTGTDVDRHGVLDEASDLLSSRYAIDHATLQVEPEDHHGCTERSW